MEERERLRGLWERVGQLTGNIAMLELALQHLVWAVMDDGNRAIRVVTKRMNLRQLAELGGDLVEAGFPENEAIRQRLKELVNDAKDANAQRNTVVHSLAAVVDGDFGLSRVRDWLEGSGLPRVQDVSEVEGLVQRTAELIKRAQMLHQEITRPAQARGDAASSADDPP